MKPVNITSQVILFFIPIAGYYAWHRIGKFWRGLALNLGLSLMIVPLFVFPEMLLYQNYLFIVATVMILAIKIHFLIKWSKEYNMRCENDKEN